MPDFTNLPIGTVVSCKCCDDIFTIVSSLNGGCYYTNRNCYIDLGYIKAIIPPPITEADFDDIYNLPSV